MRRRKKNRRPNANGIRPAVSAVADTFAGTSRSIALLRNGRARQNFRNDLIGRDAFEIGFRLEQHAMAKNGSSGGLHVIGNQKIAPSIAATAFATSIREIAARGLAPRLTAGELRVARTMETM